MIFEISLMTCHRWVTIWQVVFEVENRAEQERNAFFQSVHQGRLSQLAEAQNHSDYGHSRQHVVYVWKYKTNVINLPKAV